MAIRAFELKNVGPFDDIRFEFDDHVNVFVGPNNSGKTCALMAFADLVVYPPRFPRRFLRGESGSFQIHYGGTDGVTGFGARLPFEAALEGPPYGIVDEIVRCHKEWTQLVGAYRDMLASLGFARFVPAIRLNSNYRSKGPVKGEQIPRAVLPGDGDFFADVQAVLERVTAVRADMASVADDELVQMIVDLDYRGYRDAKPHLNHLIGQVAAVASEITEGFPIEFAGVREDKDGLYPSFRTPDGELPLNCLSQGTQSTIQWLGQLLFSWAQFNDYAKDFLERPATLIIDEIDAHLHPSWQRRIIPALTKHFPNLQLFCSTHSPLMLAGLRAGQVQLLKRSEEGGVTVSRNPFQRWRDQKN